VFDLRDGVTTADEPLILEAIHSGRFRLVFDLYLFLEPLLAFQGISASESLRAAVQLDRILKWCDRRRTANSAEALLVQAVLSCSGEALPSEEFLDGPRNFDTEIAKWDRNWSPRSEFWQEAAEGLRSERERYVQSFQRLLDELGPRDGFRAGEVIPRFDEFWNEHKHRIVESIAKSVCDGGIQSDVIARGLRGLLDNKCLRLAASSIAGLMYAQFYNEGHPVKVRRGDAADIRHVTVASVAEVFVTHDWPLYKRLSAAEVALRDFAVFYLDDFLSALRSTI
jgi:hypothetical protein